MVHKKVQKEIWFTKIPRGGGGLIMWDMAFLGIWKIYHARNLASYYISSPWIWKGVSATLYIQGDDILYNKIIGRYPNNVQFIFRFVDPYAIKFDVLTNWHAEINFTVWIVLFRFWWCLMVFVAQYTVISVLPFIRLQFTSPLLKALHSLLIWK